MYSIHTATLHLLLAVGSLIAAPAFAQESNPARISGEAAFEGLGDLSGGPFQSSPFGVSANGFVAVGHGISENGQEAFRWEDGTMEGLGSLLDAPFASIAYGASSDGAVVVGISVSTSGPEAFRWENGEMEGLGYLPGGGSGSIAYGASADGTIIVGSSDSENGISEAFRWVEDPALGGGEGGAMEGLGDLPGGDFASWAVDVSADGTVVVGYSQSDNGIEACRWEDGTIESLGELESGASPHSVRVSADGSVVVGYGVSGEGSEAFRWEDGMMRNLGDFEGGTLESKAYGVSADGGIVVGFGTSEGGQKAFLWTEEDDMRSVKEILEDDYGLDLTGWSLTNAYDISDDGTVIVGDGINPDGNTEAWRAVIPRPVADEATPEALADVLSAPSPNPTSRASTFTIAVEHGQHVAVEVFDAMGRRVKTLYEGVLAAGMSEPLTLKASSLPAGVYVVRATGKDFAETQRVTVVR